MIGMRKLDHRIGPGRGWNSKLCGFNSDPKFDIKAECRSELIIRHFMMNDVDEEGYYPGAFACALHVSSMPKSLILLEHSVGIFCGMEGSSWNLELNECQMPIETFELALLGTLALGKDIDEEFKRNSTRNNQSVENISS